MHKIYTNYLHLLVLISFAVAQPIYDLLGKYPEFLVAHAATPALILSTILVLSFGLAFVLILVELLARILGEHIQQGINLLFAFVLFVLIFLPLIKKFNIADFSVIGISGLLGGICTVLYARFHMMRMLMTAMLPVVLIFPVWFLFATPVSRILLPHAESIQQDIYIKNPVPIVLIVFDEFHTAALLDSNERIDPIRFPNFSALAKESTWYPNACTVTGSTTRAIPTIVTGKDPKPNNDLMPTATDHPNNLFTMLGKHYYFNVWEADTALCPKALCIETANASDKKWYHFLSDLVVIYAHIIGPPKITSTLPSLDTRWAGFGRNLFHDLTNKNESSNDVITFKGVRLRHIQVNRFLDRIYKTEKPGLHFAHITLPHVPYIYLPSGQQYSGDEVRPLYGIRSEREGWTGEEPLIITAYSRYIQQVGFVDKVLGMIRDKLISEGIYENSLMIVMADHGVAFERGQSRRCLSDDFTKKEILKIPLLIKLPGQKQGLIDNRIITISDILPTIIDVIRANVPWEFDGHSTLKGRENAREGWNFIGLYYSGYINGNDLLGFPRLKWQVEHFGEHTPLDRLVPKGPFNELVGCEPSKLQIGESTNISLISNTIHHFQYVDTGGRFLPLLFSGHIEGASGQNLPLAIATNDKIQITTSTSTWNEKENFFSVLLPQSALQLGRNILRVYVIEQSGKTLLLHPVNENQKEARLQQVTAAEDILILDGNIKIVVYHEHNNMNGYLEHLNIEKEEMLAFTGWAVDLVEERPATNILIFKGESLVWQVVPDIERKDVADGFNKPSLLVSGFLADVPIKAFKSIPGDVSIIAVSGDRRALKLQISDEHHKILGTTISE